MKEVDLERVKAEKHAAAIALAKNYNRCFATPEGQKVIEHLSATFLINNDTSLDAKNVNYEAAYHNGEAGAVRYILAQISKAATL